MNQERYQKLIYVRRKLMGLKRQGIISNFRIQGDSLVLPVGVQFNDSADWIFYSLDRLLMKLKDGTLLKEAELRTGK